MQNEILTLLQTLRFKGMLNAFDKTMKTADTEGKPPLWVIFELLRAEYSHQQERSMANRLTQAKLPWNWTLETFPFDRQPTLNKQNIHALSSLEFMQRTQNIILIGPPGTGKTGIAIGLLREAIVNGFRGRFYNAQTLIDELYASLADRTTTKLLNKLARYDLLVIDELSYLSLKLEHSNAFFKLLDQRYGRKSTIITSNLDYADWYQLFQSKSLVDAMLDRLRHHCITIHLKGASLRTPDK